MKEKHCNILCIVLTIIALVIAFMLELYIKPGYLIKCIVKVSTFGGIIVLYAALTKKKFADIISFHKPEKIGVLLGSIALFFVGIVILFFIFKNNIDWSSIRESLISKEGFTKKNCFIGFTYIIVANSFLEEAFGGLVRNHNKKDVLKVIEIISNDDVTIPSLIKKYVQEAEQVSK